MNRIALLAAVALVALTSSLPALADGGASVKGVVAALSASGVVVKDAHHTVACAVKPSSPSLAGYAVGDRVQVQCRGGARHLVLAKIRHLTGTASSGSHEAEPIKFGGTVTALSPTSVSLLDGARTLTCTLDDTSQSTSDLKVGVHARVVCRNGVLVSWTAVTPADAAHVYEGVVTAVTSDSIAVHAVHQDVTCSLGDGSPSIAEVQVGDRVAVGCRVGSTLLVLLKRLPAQEPRPPKPPEPTTAPAPQPSASTTAGGTLTALSSTSLTVHNEEHGDVTCSVTDGSPRLGDYHLGDHVKIACADGVLKLIAKF